MNYERFITAVNVKDVLSVVMDRLNTPITIFEERRDYYVRCRF